MANEVEPPDPGSERRPSTPLPQEARTLERQLADARRALADRADLAAVGRSAAAFAHELNNPTFAIGMAAEVVRGVASGLAPGVRETLHKHVDLITEQAQSIGSMARAIRELTQPVQLDPRPVDLAAWLATTLSEVTATLDRPALATGARCATVVTDPQRLRDALLPLIVNAVEADPHRPSVVVHLSEREGGYALDVTDRGAGVPAEVLDDLFTPFASTKGGRGNGLGLALARRAALDLGGTLELHATGEAGTTVRLWLPGGTGSRGGGAPSERPVVERAGEVGPAGRVVVLDDNEAVRTTVAALLRRGGLSVEAVADAGGAERCITEGPVDLLLTDLHFATDVSLADLLDRLERLQPGVRERTVVITGDLPSAVPPLGIARVLSKPFGCVELETAVADVLR